MINDKNFWQKLIWFMTISKIVAINKWFVIYRIIDAVMVYIVATNGMINMQSLSLLIVSIYLGSIGAYLYNDTHDYQEDLINKKLTAVTYDPKNIQSVRNISIVFMFLGGILALMLNFTYNIMIAAFMIILAIAYSHPATHLKTYFIIKTLSATVASLLMSLIGITAANQFTPQVLPFLILVVIAKMALSPLADITDYDGDKQCGRRTLPVVLGIKRTFIYIEIMTIISGAIAIGWMTLFMNKVSYLAIMLIVLSEFFALKNLFIASRDFSNNIIMKRTDKKVSVAFILIRVAILLNVFYG